MMCITCVWMGLLWYCMCAGVHMRKRFEMKRNKLIPRPGTCSNGELVSHHFRNTVTHGIRKYKSLSVLWIANEEDQQYLKKHTSNSTPTSWSGDGANDWLT